MPLSDWEAADHDLFDDLKRQISQTMFATTSMPLFGGGLYNPEPPLLGQDPAERAEAITRYEYKTVAVAPPMIHISRVEVSLQQNPFDVVTEDGVCVQRASPEVTITCTLEGQADTTVDVLREGGSAVLLTAREYSHLLKEARPEALNEARKLNAELEVDRVKAETRVMVAEDKLLTVQAELEDLQKEVEKLRNRPEVTVVYEPSF